MFEQYIAHGLSALPAITSQRRPAVSGWKEYQQRLPNTDEVTEWNATICYDGACIVCGAVSGNLEMIDFDLKAEAFRNWQELVPIDLYSRLVVERSQSGGAHVVYRCESPVEGNMKLASREHVCEDDQEVEVCGKSYRPRKRAQGGYSVVLTMIETRGEGGLFVCAPSPGYVLMQGDFTEIPTITADERQILLDAARELNQYIPEPVKPAAPSHDWWSDTPNDDRLSPGDDYNNRGDVRGLLLTHGWKLFRTSSESEQLTRPGKQSGVSASLKDGALFVFTSNAPPFEPQTSYCPFAVYTLLECDGDYVRAAKRLRQEGYGEQSNTISVDFSNFTVNIDDSKDDYRIDLPPAGIADPVIQAMQDAGVTEELEFNPVALDQIRRTSLADPVIHGLLRREETMNLVAASKVGKTWLTISMAISVATGMDWLGHEVEQGRVLHIDNELKEQTLTYRYDRIADEMGLPLDLFGHNIEIQSLRGKLKDIRGLGRLLLADRYPRGHFSLIILDALYRCLPAGMDENDNGAMAQLYNLIDMYSERTGAAIVLVHHTSKGVQTGKAVTDVGSGAGSQSRAADTHAVLRPSEDGSAILFDAAARTWPPMKTQALRFKWPLFETINVDLTKIAEQASDKKEPLKVEEFVGAMITNGESYEMVVYNASQIGVSEKETKRLLKVAQEVGLVERVRGQGGSMVFKKTSEEGEAE